MFDEVDINFQKILPIYFDSAFLKRLQKVKVIIIGCGGLGSNIAPLLVRSGITHITLVDHDKVEIENLNRQNYTLFEIGKKKTEALKELLLKINNQSFVNVINIKLDSSNIDELISPYDVVVEAVDDKETKALIFNKACELGKYVVSASGVAGFGDCENIKIKRGKNFAIVGDFKTSVEHKRPVASKVCAIASIQADEILRMVKEDELHLFNEFSE